MTGVGIKTIACGLMHSGCVLQDGSVYQWGSCGDYAKVKEMKNQRELLLKCICQFPSKVNFRGHRELVSSGQPGSLNQRKRSSAGDADGESYAAPLIKDIKMGEQFTMALSMKGYVYTWGANDKGQLGLGVDTPAFDPMQVPQIGPSSKHSIRPVTKIACGLKHCLVLTSNDKLFAWGSNLQCQLGRRLVYATQGGQGQQVVLPYSNVPIEVTAYE